MSHAHAPYPAHTPALTPNEGEAALTQIGEELAALRADELLPIRVDVVRAATIVLGTWPTLATLRPRIVDELPCFSIERFDRLPAYALATWYAHLLSLPPDSPENPVKPLLDEAHTLRESLLVGAEGLAHFGLLDAKRVAAIRSGLGNIDVANDLGALSALYREAGPAIAGKTPVTAAQVDRAAALGPALLIALGVRDHDAKLPAAPGALADQRNRAFTLFARAYDQCRRAVTYLRWDEGDADTYAPSIYGYRRPQAAPAPTADAPATPPADA